jgi:hypothetical protein
VWQPAGVVAAEVVNGLLVFLQSAAVLGWMVVAP